MLPSIRPLAPLLAFCIVGLPGRSQPVLDEAESVLLQPLLGRVPLADSITAFPTTEGALIPLGELCRIMSLGITVDPEKGRAEGFFIDEKRRFSLDLGTRAVVSDGRVSTLPPNQAVLLGNDIYVEAHLLAEWFPLEVALNLKASALVLTPKEVFPIQEAWAREGNYMQGLPGTASALASDEPVGVPFRTPYRFLDMPFVDLSTYWGWNKKATSTDPAFNAIIAGDVLWMSALVNVARTPDGEMERPIWTLFREDPRGELLGPLHAKAIEIGDIPQPPTLGVAGALPDGRGLLVDNFPLGYRSKFASRTFTGPLQQGWTVELYQNTALIGMQRARPDGQYEFKNIPLRYGLNIFRFVFRGPFGQLREETTRLDIANERPSPGSLFYRVTGIRPDDPGGVMTPAEKAAMETATEKNAYLAQTEYGVSRHLSVSAGAAQVAHSDGFTHRYADVGLKASLPYLSVQLNSAQERTSNGTSASAQGIGLRTGYNYSTLGVDHARYEDGFREMDALLIGTNERQLADETTIQWDGTMKWGKQLVALSLHRNARGYRNGDRSTLDMARATFTYPSFTLTPMLSRSEDSGTSSPETIEGSVYLTGRRGDYNLQSSLGVSRVDGRTKLTSWSAQVDRVLPSGLQWLAGVKGASGSLGDASILAGISQQSGRFGYGVDLQYAKASGTSINLRAQASFGREPRTRRWVSDARLFASQGALSAIAFVDENGNKQRDAEEQVLEGTQFKVGTQTFTNAIQDPRVTFATSMPRAQDTLVQVDESSFEDPAHQSTVKVYRFVPRPGKVAQIDFPVTTFGVVDGTTRIRRGNASSEFGGLEVELLRADGTSFRRLRSAYDGYFELRDIPVGEYILRVPPSEVTRLKLKSAPERRIRVDAAKNLFEGQDITIIPSETPSDPPLALPPAP